MDIERYESRVWVCFEDEFCGGCVLRGLML